MQGADLIPPILRCFCGDGGFPSQPGACFAPAQLVAKGAARAKGARGGNSVVEPAARLDET